MKNKLNIKFQKINFKYRFCNLEFDTGNLKCGTWSTNSKKTFACNLRFGTWCLMFVFYCFFLPKKLNAQKLNDPLPKIDLKEAVQLSAENFYLLQNKRLRIKQQEALKISSWDFGRTEVFTGGEELGETTPGVYTTIGIRQQGIDVFGIVPKNNFYREKISLAEKKYEVSSLELAKKVKSVWAKAYVAKRKYGLFVELDSIYRKFEKAVALKYKVEAISRLEMLTAKNRADQIHLQKLQAHSDYLIALQELNLWLGTETNYTVTEEIGLELLPAKSMLAQDFGEHPLMQVSQQQVAIAEAKQDLAQAAFFPELSLQYGLQKINGNSGFYNYEIGISIPLLSGGTYGNAKAAKIQQQIAEQQAEFNEQQLKTGFQKALQQYQKWKTSWEYYKNNALPLAEEQRKSSLFAYKNGGIEYVAFIQNLNNAVAMENEALEVLENYLNALFNLQFYLVGRSY